MASWPIRSSRMAAQPATASPKPGGHNGRSVQMASISTLGGEITVGSGSVQQADAWLQHRWPAAASAADISTFMLLAATACLQRPAHHVGMHSRGILGILCVMGMCICSRLEVLYGHEHNVERHRLYARIM